MSLFRKIKDIVSPPRSTLTEQEFVLPYGLKTSEWARIKTLPSDEAFKTYQNVLDELVKFNGESILQISNVESLNYLRGFVAGLRKAGTVIDEISIAERNHDRAKRDARDAGARRSFDGGEFFGTPHFRR